MNKGQFAAQLNEIEKILKSLSLIKERNLYPRYNNYDASFFRKKTYVEYWNHCYVDKVYDFFLTNDSMLQFRFNHPLDINYVFLDCPYHKALTFEEFVDHSDEYDDISIIRDYDYYIAEFPKLKETVTPIRYDFKPEIYIEGRHPAAHFHFGHGNEIRVGTKKILLPISFLLLLIRQCFPKSWAIFLSDHPQATRICRYVREHPEDIQSNLWNMLDEFEMIFV